MLRSQRILIVVGLILIAWILHVSMCDWVYKKQVSTAFSSAYVREHTPICAWVVDPTATGPPRIVSQRGSFVTTAPGFIMPRYIGLFSEEYVGLTEALLLGVITPLLLLMLVGYLLLGWRPSSRRLRGLCVNCGYDLRGATQPLVKCPECGTSAHK